MQPWEVELQREVHRYVGEKGSLEAAMKDLETFFRGRKNASGTAFEKWLAPALILGVLAGLNDASATEITERTEKVNAVSDSFSVDSVRSVAKPVLNSDEPDVSAGFDVQFKEAIDDFAARGVVTADEFALLDRFAKARAFSVGGLTDQYALDSIKHSLETAIEDGTPMNQWLTQIEDFFQEKGLAGPGPEDAAHMRLVYRANVNSAYNAGRWTQQQRTKKGRPYLQRISVAHGLPEAEQIEEHDVRPTHAQADGVIRPVDDEYWTASYPPYFDGEYEYNCRCMAVSVSREEMVDEGLRVTPDDEINLPELDPDAQNSAQDFFRGNDKIETGSAGESIYRALIGG